MSAAVNFSRPKTYRPHGTAGSPAATAEGWKSCVRGAARLEPLDRLGVHRDRPAPAGHPIDCRPVATADAQRLQEQPHAAPGVPHVTDEMKVDAPIADVPWYPTVFVCGGNHPLQHVDKRLLNWLRRLARHGSTLGAIDTGAEMRMVFRVKDFDEKRGFRRYFWKATPV